MTIWWLTAARPADVQSLRWNEVLPRPDLNPPALLVTFTTHKTKLFTQPYTVHTALAFPTLFTDLPTTETPIFFKQLMESVVKLLQLTNPVYEAKSVRRGSLITMAEAGGTVPALREFSLHSSEDMLMRYLGWGRSVVHLARQGATLAQALFQ